MRRTATAVIAGLAAAALTTPMMMGSASAAPPQPDPLADGLLGAGKGQDVDNRRGSLAPTAAQRAADRRTPGRVRWNELGTPGTVSTDGVLARGLSRDPEQAARAYLSSRRDLFGLDPAAVGDLETLAVVPVGKGSIVTLRQRVEGLPLTQGGLVTVAVRDGSVVHVSSSLTRDTESASEPTLTEADARSRALRAAGLAAGDAEVLRIRQVAVPTPSDGTRAAFEVVLAEKGGHGDAFTVLVDATSGEVLVREDLVDHAEDNPEWELFGGTPPDEKSTDRETWCWLPMAGCEDPADNGASPYAWDVDAATGESTFTTQGNNAVAGKSWDLRPNVPAIERTATPSTGREYVYGFDNIWRESGCDPQSLTTDDGNDIDAATASLFAHHNRLHDWSYRLGFTEETWNAQSSNFDHAGAAADPEIGKAQSGARLGYRDNANQYTPPDGIAPWSNMYLWQPIAGGAYVPCVDGDFDGTVIGHEYTHMISNRMVAGPDAGLSGYQARGMGESWSDLVAMEYLFELGKRPKGDTPYVTGAYVTGDDATGIRNFDMSRSTLNYSNIGYDVVGPSVHSEGEIWSATNFSVRQAFVDEYGAGSAALQRSCADGDTPVAQCPGNRRWIQLVFDAFLVPATGSVSMVDMRDAILVADRLRFDGANEDLIWGAFAGRGLGAGARSAGADDMDPVPSFASPSGGNGTATFRVAGTPAPVKVFIGEFEKQTVPVADTDPGTALGDTVRMVAGRYDALAVGPTVGHQRFTFEVKPGVARTVTVPGAANLAAAANGAMVAGDGTDADDLIDGTESTSWEATADDVDGLGVTVDLAGQTAQDVRRVTVSAFYESGSRFSALRQFRVLACNAETGAACDEPGSFEQVFLSPADSFPGDGMRPTAPDLNAASFDIPQTAATHLRFEVVANQCTGGPSFQGELDNDPSNPTDCPTGAPSVASTVRAAEFQAFSR